MTYGSRTPDARKPSGGSLTKPIQGMGKLTAGTHRVEVLAVNRTGSGLWDVVLADPARHCHLDTLEHWPPEWAVGTALEIRIAAGPGLAVCRDGGRFQARSTVDGTAATDWLPSVQAVYDAVPAGPWATTELKEARDVRNPKRPGEWHSLRVARPPVHSAAAVQPAAPATASGAAPAAGPSGGSSDSAGGGG